MGYSTNTELVIYIQQLFSHLKEQFGWTLPMRFSRVAQLIACLRRLNVVLNADELEKGEEEKTEKPSIMLKNVGFRLRNTNILKNVNIDITSAGLTVVIGAVSSGKSSLIKVLLKEYYPVSEGGVCFP